MSSPSSSSSSSAREVIVVTGSNTGVGFESARQLAVSDAKGSRTIILACRTKSKADAAVETIRKEVTTQHGERGGTVVETLPLDLMDFHSITSFVTQFTTKYPVLHVLINNAGVNSPPMRANPKFDVDGQWLANYFGHYLLTKLLLPTLERSAPSRVINVSSYMHRLGSTNFRAQCRLSNSKSYSTSKLAQVYHAFEMQRRWGSAGINFFVTHPGACHSEIWRSTPSFLQPLQKVIFGALFLTTEQGAKSSVHAATKPVSKANEVEHFGPYPVREGWANFVDLWQPSCRAGVFKSRPAECAYDEKIAADLIKFSDELCEEWDEAAKPD